MSGTNYIASNWRTPTNQNSSKNDNYGLSFDGTGYIDCGNDPQIQLTGDISISVWFKTTSTDTMVIAAKRYNTLGDAYGWQVYCSGGKLAFLVTRSGPTTTNFVGTTTISDGAWHHVLCTINQNSQIAVILDGSTEGTAPLPAGTFIDSNSDLRIGRGTSLVGPPYYFNGEISEVALFDYLASGATLYGNATSGSGNPMALKPTPVGYWPLGDNSASDPLAQPNVAVEDASVFDFDNGATNQITLPSDFIAANEFFWLNPDNLTLSFIGGDILGNGTSSQNWINPSSATTIRVKPAGTLLNFLETGGNNLTVGSWNHILIYRDSSNDIGIFVNGSPFSTPQNNSDILTLQTIGRGVNKFYDGEMSNVALWNSDQSSEISNIYNSGVPATSYTNIPTAWYKLDQSANWEADTVGTWQIPDAVSEFPQSFNFSPADEYFDTKNNPLIGASNLSISAWFNSADVDPQYLLGDSSVRFSIKQSNGDTRISFTGSTDPFRGFGIPYNISEWNHLILTFDGSLVQADRLKLYHNGVEINNINAGTPSTTLLLNTAVSFMIGRAGGTSLNTWNGKISNVQLWDVTLTPEKVTTLYNGGTPTLTPPNQSDLKAWYKLDGSDKSIWNSSSATDTWLIEDANITPTYTEGLFFGGGYIGGSPVQNYAGLKLTNQTISASHISYSAWVKIIQPEVGSTTTIFNPNLSFLGDFSYRASSKTLQWSGDASAKYISTGPTTINSGSWHHIFCSYPNGSTIDHTQVKIYIDGVLQANTYIGGTTSTGPVTNMLGILLGSAPKNMVISNWAFWLNDQSSNIATIYNNGTPGDLSTLNPEVWYKLNSANTTLNGVTGGEYGVATDSSGNNNNGDIAGKTDGTTTRLETSNVQARTGTSSGMTEQSLVNNNVSALNGESSGMTSGNLVLSDLTRNLPYQNYSLDFDGSLDYIDCGDSDIFSFGNGTTDSPFSISAWIKPSSMGTTFHILNKENNTTTGDEYVFYITSDTLHFAVCDQNFIADRQGRKTTTLTASEIDNVWGHVVATYDGRGGSTASDGINIYVNGVNKTDATFNAGSYTAMHNTTSNVKIGSYSSGVYFNGKISNTSIFNVELTPTEVLKLYANGLPQDLTNFTPQPISWWTLGKESFWDGADWIIRDMIGTNDGLSDNMGGSELKGDAPRSQANGVGTSIAVPTNLKGEAGWSDKNGYSINMSSTARTTDTP